MKMVIRYQTGRRVEAVLLAANSQRMRVVAGSERDTIELDRIDGCWYTETGTMLEIEALIPIPGTDVSRFCAEVYPRAISAGGKFSVV